LASQKKLLKQLIVLDKVIARYAHEPIQPSLAVPLPLLLLLHAI
jgi:hypothetical protein